MWPDGGVDARAMMAKQPRPLSLEREELLLLWKIWTVVAREENKTDAVQPCFVSPYPLCRLCAVAATGAASALPSLRPPRSAAAAPTIRSP
ncbi:Protein of unknown function [Gryllus bimaculatus]|nr:Protein of unknown function [Gryllus bimaculatus]